LNCDGHCGRKCDPSTRKNFNCNSLPWCWYCETCRKKRENPNLPPYVNLLTRDETDKLLKEKNFLKKENDELKKEKEKFDKIKESFDYKYHDYRHNLQKFYDIIINIDSLRNLYKCWKVKFKEQGRKNHENTKESIKSWNIRK